MERNRIKRLTREAYRLNKHLLYESLDKKQVQMAVFFIYTAKKIIPFSEVAPKISVILERLVQEAGLEGSAGNIT